MTMKKIHNIYLLLTLMIMSALCSCGDDDYQYPTVKLEFITVTAGDDGSISSIVNDNGVKMNVTQDLTSTTLKAGASLRAVSNYETLEDNSVVIYSLSSALSATPLPPTDETFKDGIKTDPLTVQSAWLGYRYLNMLLQIKADGNNIHRLHFVEEELNDTDEEEREVTILIYHDSKESEWNYTSRAYASIPLEKYLTEGVSKLVIHIRYNDLNNIMQQLDFTY
jgi:hypothetical protein